MDEVGCMPMAMQNKLLRTLEDGEIVRVGANSPEYVDIRLVSATDADLPKLVSDNTFSKSFYARIKGGRPIEIPPLRERQEDILVMIKPFLALACVNHGKDVTHVTKEAERALLAFPWPDNVRQLKIVIEYAVAMATRNVLTIADLPEEITSHEKNMPPTAEVPLTPRFAGGNHRSCIEKMQQLAGRLNNRKPYTNFRNALAAILKHSAGYSVESDKMIAGLVGACGQFVRREPLAAIKDRAVLAIVRLLGPWLELPSNLGKHVTEEAWTWVWTNGKSNISTTWDGVETKKFRGIVSRLDTKGWSDE